RGRWQDLEAGTASVIEQRYATFDTARDASVAAVLHGRLALIPGPVSAAFAQSHDPSTRQFIARVIGRMWQPAVRVEAPPTVDISLRRKGARMVLHLTNSTGMQVAGDYAAVDFIAPAGPLGVSIDLPARPREVRLEPAGRVLPGIWNGSAWSATIDKLDIHAMVTFDVGRT
ncbi:MAG TPA: hypothetical protein VFL57_12730, partial [Bryobacteraceae bacterium]|nr:hypothetical protein [Bryobacteraceae bacterium]